MQLTKNEEKMLSGAEGKGVQKAMKLLVTIGEAFHAKRMGKITRAHVALSAQEGDLHWVEELVKGGATCKVPPTTNPCWDIDYLAKYFSVSENELQLVKRTIEAYRKIGAILSFSCTPYLEYNIPRFGEHVAFSESSATPYVNSVLGARSNREASPSALAAAVTGVTPEYGFHLEKNRKATMLIKVKAPIKDDFDYSLLGWWVGGKVGDEVPVFVGMPKDPTPESLRNLGAELNTSGAVSLYHIVGVTPEAPTLDKVLSNQPKKDLTVTEEDLKQTYEEISERSGKINLVLIGCPHATLNELKCIANLLEGKKIHRDTALWILTSAHTKELARKSGYLQLIEAAGGHIAADTCIDEPCWKSFEGRIGMTDSPKNAYYRERRGQPFILGSLSNCIKAAIRGEWENGNYFKLS